jgi:exonuclease SbcC
VEHAQRLQRQPELEAAAAALQRQVSDEAAGIAGLLAGHGITGLPEPGRAAAAVAARRAQADGELRVVRQNLDKASRLDRQISGHRDEVRVATMLGNLLKATSFERWLCGEALDSLMTEASRTLMELSGGQYQLDRDDRNDLIVIDYQDAAARRPVHTLSGGETFQASLALALALSRQVIGLSGGMRDLSSIFLDEGFGTLDEDTLETVATTLEQLAADSDRMVGVITHVPALAERAPVRFVVSRAGGTSTIRKERA